MAVKALTMMTVEPIEENTTNEGYFHISCVPLLTRRHEEPSHNHGQRLAVSSRQCSHDMGGFITIDGAPHNVCLFLWNQLPLALIHIHMSLIILAFPFTFTWLNLEYNGLQITKPGNHAAARGVQGSALWASSMPLSQPPSALPSPTPPQIWNLSLKMCVLLITITSKQTRLSWPLRQHQCRQYWFGLVMFSTLLPSEAILQDSQT